MQMVYQWLLQNNQQTNYATFVTTEYWYHNRQEVIEHCCMECLYSPIRPIEESGIDLDEVPFMSRIILDTRKDIDENL